MILPKHLDIHNVPGNERETIFIGFRGGVSVVVEVPSVGEGWRAHALKHSHLSVFACGGLFGGGRGGIVIFGNGWEAINPE